MEEVLKKYKEEICPYCIHSDDACPYCIHSDDARVLNTF